MATRATAARERALNDRLRQHGIDRTTVVTPGMRALGPDAVSGILAAVASFNASYADNDPYGEHDCGRVTVEGRACLFKIEYLDWSLAHHSPDPADPNATHRVMILMLAEEY